MPEKTTPAPHSKRWLTRGVLGIGLASLFSDWGHEAATAILPAFLASLGAPAYALGIIEGVSDGLSSFAKLAGGWIADRPALRKPAGIIGYLATGLSTFAYAFAHTWPAILVIRALGWVGRGGRGPSRDTLLANAVAPGTEGRAFGFERAMDTIGAVLGPLCATALHRHSRHARRSSSGRSLPVSPPPSRSRSSRPLPKTKNRTSRELSSQASANSQKLSGISSLASSPTASATSLPRS